MVPATLAYLGCSAADVCTQLAQYDSETRCLHAIDALATAIAYKRKDTVEMLIALGTPLRQPGLLGIVPKDAMDIVFTPAMYKHLSIVSSQ